MQKSLIAWICFSLISLGHGYAAETFFSNSDSEFHDLFCTHSKTETNTIVRLFRFAGAKTECLFEKTLQGGIHPPLCFSNGVIVGNAYGVIKKYDLAGNLIFEAVPSGITGACGWSGKLKSEEIYLTETLWNEKKRKFYYRLHVVNVAGAAPVVRKTFDIIQPAGIIRSLDDLVVIGEHEIRRIKLSE
jgi:hypothetical protein